MRSNIMTAIFLVFLLSLYGCGSAETGAPPHTQPAQETAPSGSAETAAEDFPEAEVPETSETPEFPEAAETAEAFNLAFWLDAELTDISAGETFSISEFRGKPVLVESFAVWCPICTRQQQELKKVKESGADIVSVAINTDPNEDEARVRGHIERHGFDWHYAVASAEVTDSLIEEFGFGIVNAPQAPVILVCGDQTVHKLRNGVKPADELVRSAEDLCA